MVDLKKGNEEDERKKQVNSMWVHQPSKKND